MLNDTARTGPFRRCADAPRPLDFLVNGQLLRQSLLQLMLDNDISAVRAALAPELHPENPKQQFFCVKKNNPASRFA
jgi:hypothetical protein